MTAQKAVLGVGAVLLAAAFLYVASAVSFVFWPDVRDFVVPQEFTTERWRQAGNGNLDSNYNRWRMRYSLMRKHDLSEMSEAEVKSLLGPGDSDDNVLRYYLGPTGHGINHGVLQIRFNKKGQVEHYEFRQH